MNALLLRAEPHCPVEIRRPSEIDEGQREQFPRVRLHVDAAVEDGHPGLHLTLRRGGADGEYRHLYSYLMRSMLS